MISYATIYATSYAYATTVFLKNIFKKIVYLKDFREGSIFENKVGERSIFEYKNEKTVYKIIPLKLFIFISLNSNNLIYETTM